MPAPAYRAAAAALVSIVAACSAPFTLDVPDVEGARALLVAVEGDGREPVVSAHDVGERFRIYVERDAEIDVTTVVFERSLAELGIASGIVEPAPPDRGQPVPEFLAAYEQHVERGEGAGWRELEALRGVLRDLRLPGSGPPGKPSGPGECVAAGGCYDGGECKVPCADPPEVAAPADVMPPAPPVLGPCPEGWSERAIGCAPPAAVSCPPGEAQMPFSAGCSPVGAECPAMGDWPADLPAGAAARFVRQGAPAGGDGSRGAPLGSIREAVEGAAEGTIVAIAAGTYREVLRVPARVTLWGACARDVAIEPGGAGPHVIVDGAGAELRGLRFEGVWIAMAPGGDALFSGVVSGGAAPLFTVSGSSRLELRGSALMSGDQGAALSAFDGGEVVISESIVAGGAQGALHIRRPGTRAVVSRAYLRGGGTRAALRVEDGATVELDESALDAGRAAGLHVAGPGAQVDLRDVVFRGGSGASVVVSGGAALRGERVVIENGESAGLFLSNEATTATVTDFAVIGTRARGADGFGDGAIVVELGARAWLARGVVEQAVEHGLIARGAGTRVALDDALIGRVTRWGTGEGSGAAVEANGGARVELRRVASQDTEVRGVRAGGQSILVAEDLAISGVTGDESVGLWVSGRANATVDRLRIERSDGLGADVLGAARLDASDVRISATELGGILASGGSHVGLRRAHLAGNRFLGIGAAHGGTLVTLEDAVIESTAEAVGCGSVNCTGRNLQAAQFARIAAQRFALRGPASYGILVDQASEVDLSQGEVAGHGIGALIANDLFDVRRLLDRVRFRDNAVQLDLPGD